MLSKSSMSERKFSRALSKPGVAAQLRETVSQVVRESAVQNKARVVEPLDYETFLLKNKTALQNDPHKDLLLFPNDDVSQVVVPRKHRTLSPAVPPELDASECQLLTQDCLQTYSTNWHVIHYKYSAYSGSYLELPKLPRAEEQVEEIYEADMEADQSDEESTDNSDGVAKQGWLLKGPELGGDRMFHIASKAFKRRWCSLRQQVDGTWVLELRKDERQAHAKSSIVLDFCTEVARASRRGRCAFELRMSAGRKSLLLAAENDSELSDWTARLSAITAGQGGQRAPTPPPSPPPPTPSISLYGTLKGLEHSVNPQLSRYARETDTSIAQARKLNRRRLLSLRPMATLSISGTANTDPEPLKQHFGQRLLIRVETLRFRLQAPGGQVEPYFGSLALYDARRGCKLSETFYFDINESSAREMLPTEDDDESQASLSGELAGLQEWLIYPKQALFTITQPHPEIYLVMRLDKILQGAMCASTEPYLRAAKDQRIGLRTQRACKLHCQRLGRFRQPFAWTAKPLYRLYTSELDVVSEFPAIYRQEPTRLKDDDLLKLLQEFRRPERLSRLTVIPGMFRVSIQPVGEPPPNTLTSALHPVKPFPIPPTEIMTVEAEELSPWSESTLALPHAHFCHHLYVYPLGLAYDTQKTFARARNIACAVELRDSDTSDAQGLKLVYGRPGGHPLTNRIICPVVHHNTTPSWFEEIKFRLPVRLHSKHHLLFTLYHVSCDSKKSRDLEAETCVGFAWLPLLSKGRLQLEATTLPVAAALPPGYLGVEPLGLGKGYAGPEVQWVDNQRPLLSIGLHLASTVATTDQPLHDLFHQVAKAQAPETETCRILEAAHQMDLRTILEFLPTLLHRLLTLLSRSEAIAQSALRLLVHVVHKAREVGQGEAIRAYVRHWRVPNVHDPLSQHVAALLRPAHVDAQVATRLMRHAGFLFDVLTKSLAQHLVSQGSNARCPAEVLARVEALVQVLGSHLVQRHRETPSEARELNLSVATLLKRLLSLADRGFVFRLAGVYLAKLGPGDTRLLTECRLAFVRVLCSHEHYVALNLPELTSPPTEGERFWLTEAFCRRHFLSGLLLGSVRSALHDVAPLRKAALITLRDLLAKHELDDRLGCRERMARVASLYLPWLGVVLECLPRLGANLGVAGNCAIGGDTTSDNASIATTKALHRLTAPVTGCRDSAYFAAIAGQGMVNGNSTLSLDSEASGSNLNTGEGISIISRTSQDTAVWVKGHARSVSALGSRCDRLGPGESRDILLCFLFVVRYAGESTLTAWWTHCADSDVANFFQALELCLEAFRYDGRRAVSTRLASGIHDATSGTGAAGASGSGPSGRGTKAATLPARMQPPDFAGDKETSIPVGTNSVGREGARHIHEAESARVALQAHVEATQCAEVSLIVLDALCLYCVNFRESLLAQDGDNSLMERVVSLLCRLLELGQSESLYKHAFSALRAFINSLSGALFAASAGSAARLGRLCLALLRRCDSRMSAVRQEACACLYLLMRANFEFTGRAGLPRVHVQLVVAVSRLVGSAEAAPPPSDARLQESLSLINSFATSDKAMKGSRLAAEVKDLTTRVRTVLMATAQMRAHQHDPEALAELQHSLAASYVNTPALRRAWLEAMSRLHLAHACISEAACCQLHVAALLAEDLRMRGVIKWGAQDLAQVSVNVPLDEEGDRVDGGTGAEAEASETALQTQLELCADLLDRAERWELLTPLYRLVLPFLEARRDHPALAAAYTTLAQAHRRAAEAQRSGRPRLLGTFFRVALFGSAYFEDEAGLEWVYKEPKVTSLAEISERLKRLYSSRFGEEAVRLVPDSSPVDADTLDSKYAYIQVTHVTPYFIEEELKERPTEFERLHNIDTFMYETPFTQEGGTRGAVGSQWKRRTVLTTERVFPYVKKRVRVVSRRDEELAPIDVALDELRQRVSEIEDVVASVPPDAKRLQLHLQGAVCPQVHAGPLAYADVFLSNDPDDTNSIEYPEKLDDLRELFRDLIRVCAAALDINAKLVAPEQAQYQQMLRDNFEKMCERLTTSLSDASCA